MDCQKFTSSIKIIHADKANPISGAVIDARFEVSRFNTLLCTATFSNKFNAKTDIV